MDINRNNYEVWLTDFMDGKLSATRTEELMSFLDQNPNLKEEFEGFETIILKPGNIRFSPKEQLKKPPVIASEEIDENNCETFFIAWHENDLDASQKENLLTFLQHNPLLKDEFRLFESLKLIADQEVTYAGKEGLKHKRKIAPWWWTTSAAAVILVLFALFSLLRHETSIHLNDEMFIVKIEPKTVTISEVHPFILPEKRHETKITGQIALNDRSEQVEQPAFTFIPSRNVPIVLAVSSIPGNPVHFNTVYPEAPAKVKTGEEKKKRPLARVFHGLMARLTHKGKRDGEKGAGHKEPAMVRILDRSLMVFNTVTGSDKKLEKTFDEKGNLKEYRFEGQIISWNKKISPQPDKE